MMNLKNKLSRLAAAAVLMSVVSGAQAVSVSMSLNAILPPDPITPSDMIELQVLMDFSDDATLGGGFDIIFDPGLVSYVSESYITDPALGSDADFTRDDNPLVTDIRNRVEILPDRLAGAAFGNFGGLSGPAVVASLFFIADAGGDAVFSLGDSTSASVGGFFSAVTFAEQFPVFTGTTVNISAVPVPAAVWLFGSGLVGLVGIARRRAAT